MNMTRYWANKHSMVDEHSLLRTTSDIPMYLAADVEMVVKPFLKSVIGAKATLNRHRAEAQRLLKDFDRR